MKTMRIEPLYCRTTCGELKCPVCGYSAGEFHYREDADPETAS